MGWGGWGDGGRVAGVWRGEMGPWRAATLAPTDGVEMSPAVSWNPVIEEVAVAMVPMSPLISVRIPVLVMPAVPPKVP